MPKETSLGIFLSLSSEAIFQNGHTIKKASRRRGFVRIIGLEPTRLAAPDPKSGMSTNFTISAANCIGLLSGCKYKHKFEFTKKIMKKIFILFFVLLNF